MATLTATQKKKLSDLRELTGKFVQYQRRNRLRELTAEKANFSARVGEVIQGRLSRGTGGRFSSTDASGAIESSLSQNQLSALTLLSQGKNVQGGLLAGLESLGLVKDGKLTPNGERAAEAIANGKSPDKFLRKTGEGKPEKPKKGGGGGGGGKEEPSINENITKVNEAVVNLGFTGEMSRAFILFMNNLPPDKAGQFDQLKELGLLTEDGKPNDTAKDLFKAFESGDTKTAKAIVRLLIKDTEKSKQDAIKKANYRNAGPASTMICSTCSFAEGSNHCSRFDFTFDDNFVCDDYKPNIPALRARGRELAGKDKGRKRIVAVVKGILT